MSKRDMRAKKLLLAVLLAMSMQSYYAAPTWAAEAGQPTGQTETVDGKGQSDGTTTPAGDEAETVRKTDTKQEADEALTIMGYSVNTLNADEDAGIMPTLVGGYTGSYNAGTGSNYTVDYATAVGYNAVVNHLNSTALGYNASTSAEEQVSFGHWDSTTSTWTTTRSLAGIKNIEMAGALTGVTTINDANFTVDREYENIAIGISAKIASGSQGVVLGHEAAVNGTGGVAVGRAARTYGENATALGFWAEAFSKDSIAIGSGAQAGGKNSIAIGSNSKTISADDSVAIGFGASVGDETVNSIVIGTGSYTAKNNEVNFGYYRFDADGNLDDSAYYGRSLAGISSIDFIAGEYGNKGAITGLSSINGVAVLGSAADGLTIGGNAIIGKTDIPFSSEGFSVSNTGALTAGGIILKDGEIKWEDTSKGIIIGNGFAEGGSIAIGGASASSSESIAIGQAINTASYSTILLGYDSYIHDNSDNSIVLGESSTVLGGASYSNIIGSGSSICDDSPYSIIMGRDSTINANSKNSTIIGNGSSIESDSINSIVLGSDIYVAGSNNVALGYGSRVEDENGSVVNNSLALGAGSRASEDNQVNFGYYRFDFDNDDFDLSTYYGRSLAGISDITIVDGDQLDADNTNKITITGSRITIGGDAANQTVIENGTINSSKINGMNIFYGTNDDPDSGNLGSMAFGKDAQVRNLLERSSRDATVIGTQASVNSANAVALGAYSMVGDLDGDWIGYNSAAIGAYSNVRNSDSVALGYQAYVDEENSLALGAYSSTSGYQTVSFGHKEGDLYYDYVSGSIAVYDDNLFRNLTNIADIEMNGTLRGLADAILSADSTEAVSGRQLYATNQNVTDLTGRMTTAETSITDLTGRMTTAEGSITTVKKSTYKIEYSPATGTTVDGVTIKAGVVSSVKSINGVAIDNSGNLTTTGTYNGVTIGSGKVNGVTLGTDGTVNSVTIGTAGISGTDTFNGVMLKKDGSNYTVGDVDVTQLKTTISDSTNGLLKRTDDLETAVNDTTTGLSATYTKAEANAVSIGELQTATTGMSYSGTAGAEMTTFAGGVTAANLQVGGNFGVTADGALTAATINGVTISGTDAAKNATIGGYSLKEISDDIAGLQTSSGGNTGNISNLQTKTAGIERDDAGTTTTIEKNTSITENGLTTNKVTVGNVILENGKLTVGSVTLTNGKLSGLSDGSIASGSEEAVTGGQIYTVKTELNTAIGTKVAQSEYNTKIEELADADTALSGRATALETATTGMTYDNGTTTFVGGVAATVVTAGEFKVGATGFGFVSDGALTAKTVNGVTISGTDAAKDAAIGGYSLKTITDDIADLKTNGGATSANTVGIKHSGTVDTADSLTTIEGNTKISGSGIVVTGTVEATTLKEGGTELAAKYAGISEAYTAEKAALKADKTDVDTLKTTVGDADTGLAAVNTKVTDLQTATTGMSYDSGTTSTSFSGNVVVGNVGNQTHTQITDNAIIFGQGAEKQVTVDASGIHVGAKAMNGISTFADSNGTHIDHTSLVTGTVTAANLNGVAISGNATDGLSVGGVNIKTLDDRLATLKTTVDDIQNSGVGTADMAGVQRSDADGDGINDTTTIETATSFTKAGMKTSNLEALTAAIGGVNFAAGGVVTGINSINGTVFSSDGKIGGVSLSGGKVNGVDIKWLDQRVTSLEGSGTGGGGTGGGGGASTSGIGKPDGDTTTIEGNTTVTGDGIETNKVTASDQIIVADGKDNQTVISEDGIKVAEGKTNEVTINDKGIHVGKNSSVMNDTEGFITDKGLYIGVNSSNDISTAKFSVDKGNGTMTSKVGGYTFTNGSSGAVFSHSGDTAVTPGGSFTETTIKGNKVTTGRLDADELYVDGNKVNIAGGTIGQTDAVANHLEGTDGDGNKVTNDFKTSALNGTTQAAEQTSADGKNIIKTENNTSAGGTSVTTSKTSTNSADRKTEQSSSFVTNESGMSLNTSTKVTDKDGNVTKNTSGETKMSGDSLTVSKTTVTSKDGKEETTTSSTTVGSGEVTLHREDGSTIRVGEAIEGMQGQIQDIGSKVNEMGVEIKEVGALSAALAGLHPQPENANSRADFAMAMGSYEGKQALAVGGFYRPDKRTMLSIGASTTSSKHMMNMGISIALDKLPEAERNEQESNADMAERMKKLEADYEARLEKMEAAYEARMERLEARYARMQEAYEADKEQQKQQEAADGTQETAEAASA
ncbi:YadA-like family protein [uncultured Phascolarctobacterium sp.]|uniref:YadA-like family protein n=2 Tax=uncultured Phascolarctobacterium sp. TaxID=512296 RepID=UPI00265CEA2F|nr:YadA-like family protein [uncultured Phascolarctobacterium sp.]